MASTFRFQVYVVEGHLHNRPHHLLDTSSFLFHSGMHVKIQCRAHIGVAENRA